MVNGVTIIDFWCCSTLLFIEVTYSNKFFSNKTWLCSWKCKRKRNFCKISLCAVLLFQYRLRSWRNRGNMKKKCARLIFIEGEKNGETFNRRCDFWNVVLKGSSPCSLPFRGKFYTNSILSCDWKGIDLRNDKILGNFLDSVLLELIIIVAVIVVVIITAFVYSTI